MARALRSGRRGRGFKSRLPDLVRVSSGVDDTSLLLSEQEVTQVFFELLIAYPLPFVLTGFFVPSIEYYIRNSPDVI